MSTGTNLRDQQLIETLVRETNLSASQIAAKIGVAASTLTRVQNGTHRLSRGTIERLQAQYPSLFGDIEDAPEEVPNAYVEVEVLPSYAGMGGGGYGEGEPGRALIPRRLIEEELGGRAADFLLIDVRGDSMQDDFFHGDQVLVDRRDRDPSQPGAFALFDGDTYVVKLVERVPLKRDRLRIFSANARYSEYEISEDEARILGRPAWFGRRL